MNEAEHKQLRQIAEENDLDPVELDRLLSSGQVPPELAEVMGSVLGEVSRSIDLPEEKG